MNDVFSFSLLSISNNRARDIFSFAARQTLWGHIMLSEGVFGLLVAEGGVGGGMFDKLRKFIL